MKNIVKIFSIVLISLFAVSCHKDDDVKNPIEPKPIDPPQKPGDNEQVLDWSKFQWSKVELRFTKGHSHGYFHGNPEYPGVKYLNSVHKFIFENKDGKLVADANNPKALPWIGDSSDKGESLSGLEIIFYDKDGKRVNSFLSTGDAPNHYQFLFTGSNFTDIEGATITTTQEDVYSYKYRDTDPEDKYFKKSISDNVLTSKLRAEHIGLKGYFSIKKPYVHFNLNIVLSYFKTKPSDLVYNTDAKDKQLIHITIPVHIYTDVTNEDSAVEDGAKEFGVPKEVIEKEQDTILKSDIGESSTLFI